MRVEEGFAGEDGGREEDEDTGEEAGVVGDVRGGEGGEEGQGVVYAVYEDCGISVEVEGFAVGG